MFLSLQESDRLWQEAEHSAPPEYDHQVGSLTRVMPKQLGKGYCCTVELCSGCQLVILHQNFHQDTCIQKENSSHPIQFGAMLSGAVGDGNNGGYGNGYFLISGGGIQKVHRIFHFCQEPQISINFLLSPECLRHLFPDQNGNLPVEFNSLVKFNDWQTLLYPRTEGNIQNTAKQIFHCPYQGTLKRLYLQAKGKELIGMMLLAGLPECVPPTQISMRPETIASLYEAQRILRLQWENPPTLLELAHQVGLSDRTLQKGFRHLFNKTVCGYLIEQRMNQAAYLLESSSQNILEVATSMGYANPAQFSAAFKRQFGMTPSAYMKSKIKLKSTISE